MGKTLSKLVKTLVELVCKQCGWHWFPRKFRADGSPRMPAQCPHCRSHLWNEERTGNEPGPRPKPRG